jgi:hypothetical protein
MNLTDEQTELAAKAIFEHWAFAAPVAWVDGGNSDMQDRARRFARAALAAARAEPAEPVMWQYRAMDGPGWGPWEELKPRVFGPFEATIAERVAEIEGYIARGFNYQLRPLYAAPQVARAEPAGGRDERKAAQP